MTELSTTAGLLKQSHFTDLSWSTHRISHPAHSFNNSTLFLSCPSQYYIQFTLLLISASELWQLCALHLDLFFR